MKRSDFLKRLGIGLGVAVIAPQVLADIPDKARRLKKVYIRNDLSPHKTYPFIPNAVTPERVLKMYKETGNLLYTEGAYRINDIVYINNDKDKFVIRCQIEDGVYGIEKI